MAKSVKKLIVNFDPSQVFINIPLSSDFEKKYSLKPVILAKNKNPSYLLQKSFENRNILTRKPFLYSVKNAHAYGHPNLISRPDLHTSFFGLVFNLNKHKIFGKEQNKFQSLGDGIEVTYENTLNFKNGIFIGGSDNFGHWLFNCIGRLNYLEFLEEKIPIVIHDYMPQRFIDCISYFAKENPIIKLPANTLCVFENLFVGTSSWYVDDKSVHWWSDSAVNFLNEHFTKNKLSTNNKSIYLSRKYTNWRRVFNEDLIIKKLKELNFEIIYIEKLSIEEQIALALNSNTIVSPLGASECLYLFAAKGTKCLTLMPNICSPMFLSELYCGPLNHPHKSIIGSSIKSENTSINSDYHIDDNIDWKKILLDM